MIKCEVGFKKDSNDFDVIVLIGKEISVFEACGFLTAEVDGTYFDSILDAVKYCLES